MKRLRARWRGWWIGFSIIIAVLIFAAVFNFRSLQRLRHRERQVIHSSEVIRQLESISADVSMRLINTRQALGIASTSAQSSPLSAHISPDELVELVCDNSQQLMHARTLRENIKKFDDLLAALPQQPAGSLSQLNALLNEPDQCIREILKSIRAMRSNEDKLLEARSADTEVVFAGTLFSVLLSSLLAIAGTFAALYVAHKSFEEQLALARLRNSQDEQIKKVLEEARRTAEVANTAKSNFLASMSHELRTPLNAVIMYSEMLQEEASDLNMEHFAKDLNRIHSAGRHLLSLVNGVLDIAKIEAGKMELYLEDVCLESVVQDVSNTIRSLIEKNNNRFEVDLKTAGRIRLDVTKLRQILLNLLSNAAKFTQAGTIKLSIREIANDELNPVAGHTLQLTVSDTGSGIAADKLSDLFKPFVQAEKSTSKDYGGTGLGLTLARQFAELMHGSIAVSSTLGVGSTFEVRLPRYIDESSDNESTSDDETVDALIIDDDPNTRDFVARTLRSDNLKVRTADDGETGLRLAEQLKPRLIVLDVLMPKMDGWTVLSKLKSSTTTIDIPVVLLTLASQSELGFSLGAEEYLSKPVTREQLRAVAHRLGIAQSTRRALIVDDDVATQTVLQRMLRKEGWHVSVASDGRVALRLLAEQALEPDMILLDLQMPNMDGFDFLEAYQHESRSRASTHPARVVVLTSRDLTNEERHWLAMRVESILEKSAQSQGSLLRTLRFILKQTDANELPPA